MKNDLTGAIGNKTPIALGPTISGYRPALSLDRLESYQQGGPRMGSSSLTGFQSLLDKNWRQRH
jgi:hypothetical protein